MVELRPLKPDATIEEIARAFNRLVARDRGDAGGRLWLLDDDGTRRDVRGGATIDTANYVLRARSTGTNHAQFEHSAGTNKVLRVQDDGLQVGGTTAAASELGSGVGVIGIANATTVPTTNPTGGGVMYAQAGALKWRGSGGTTTTMGPAEPHCPDCGRDFVLEWASERYGHLVACVWCLTEGMTRGVIRREAGTEGR